MNGFVKTIFVLTLTVLVCGCCRRGASGEADGSKRKDKTYSASGYAGTFSSSGSCLRFRIEAPETGSYALTLRYGVEGEGNATISLCVNDVKVGASLSLAPPVDGLWSEHSVDVALVGGINYIDIMRGEGDNGNVLVDFIELAEK